MFSYVFIFITSFKNYLLYIPFREFAVQLISNISLDHVDVNGQLSAVEGGTFRVRCEATTTESVSDEVKYKWTLNDTEITSPRFRIISTGNYSELSVRNTTQRDRGKTERWCINNFSGFIPFPFILYVVFRTKIKMMKVTQKLSNIRLEKIQKTKKFTKIYLIKNLSML